MVKNAVNKGTLVDKVFRLRSAVLLKEFKEGDPGFIEDQEFLRIYDRIKDITLVSPYRCYQIFKIVKQCNLLEGDFAQVGVYMGGSAKLIAEVMNPEKKFYIFDTFEGLPQHDPAIDIYTKGTFSEVTEEMVRRLFRGHENIVIKTGLFPASAQNLIENKKFAFVYIDVDLYKSNKESLEYFYPRMVKGGTIVLDDYYFENCPGIAKSTDEFFTDKPEKPIKTTTYQCKIVKE